MLTGVDGPLVSEAFLESTIIPAGPKDAAAFNRACRELARCRRQWQTLGPASTVRAMLETGAVPLVAALGFDKPAEITPTDSGAWLAATVQARGVPVAVIVTRWGERLDPLWRDAVTEGIKRSAAWCLLFNGVRLRLVDAARVYARRHLEFDLDIATDDSRSLAALWSTASAGAFGSDRNDNASLSAIVAASDRHASGVCRSLRDGVLAASSEVLAALIGCRRSTNAKAATTAGKNRLSDDSQANQALRSSRSLRATAETFEQALTIVYRMLFLLFAEARALVPLWHPVYRQSYSIEALRDIAERPERAPGLWDALRAIARLAHAGCRAGDLRVTPFNGRLFSPARTPLAERRDLDDETARRAILALSTRQAPDRSGRQRIAYRDLGVEQLGAVYETLLDYEPRIEDARGSDGASRVTVSLESGSGVRKATGTFYTPQPIADYLVRRTLGPLVRDLDADRILQLRIVDPAMGSGAFLVAACRYLAAAYEAALIRDGACHASDIDDADRALMRRTIAERCLYGVDLNPMAVQLARLSLWLATLSADRPLSFLDHRLATGDSLVGAWLAHLRTAPKARRSSQRPASMPLFADDAVREALRQTLPIRFSLESIPNDTLDQVKTKERALAAITARNAAASRWKRVADAWCATWFAGDDVPASAFGALSDLALTGTSVLPTRMAARCADAAAAAAAARRFFHWELEFPEVFFDRDGCRRADGGFDAVIGNPPWDMIRADAGSAAARSRARRDLGAMLRFTRDSGIYTSQSGGHANCYQLFLERAIDLVRAGGRFGLVLPSGLATDQGSAALRRRLLTRCNVDAIIGVDNHRGVFPIHRSVRFLLVTATAGSATSAIACRFGVHDPSELEAIGDARADGDAFPVRLTPAALERLSGPDLTIPTLRSPVDVAIAERAATRFPPLGSERGWSAVFGRELNATDDRAAFRAVDRERGTRLQRDQYNLPVIEGKHIEPFHVAVDRAAYAIRADDARRLLRSNRHERPRLAYRDVASATNKMTLIAAVLPAGCVSTHTVFCVRTPLPRRAHYFLCGLFNSLVVNYLVRLRVTTHVTTATVERLPVPPPDAAPAAVREIAALARLLSRRSDPVAAARLNARVAELYHLTRTEFAHVLDTFPLISRQARDQALKRFVEETRR